MSLHAVPHFPSVTQTLFISSSCILVRSSNERHKSRSSSLRSSLHPPLSLSLSLSQYQVSSPTPSAYIVLLIGRTRFQTHKKNCTQRYNLYILRQQRVRKTTLDRMAEGPTRIEAVLYCLMHAV